MTNPTANMAGFIDGVAALLPSDLGGLTVLEHLQRMAEDAARYRWLRDNGHANWEPAGGRITLWDLHFNAPETDLNNLESAIDAARGTK